MLLPVMATLVAAVYRGTVLEEMVATRATMTIWCAP
jgi:hypothetical protein